MRSTLFPTLGIAVALAASASGALVLDAITNASLGGASTNLTGPDTSINLFGTPIPLPDNQVAVRFSTGAYAATLDQLDFALNLSNPNFLDPVQVTLSSGPTAPGGLSPITVGTATPVSTTLGGFTQVLTISPGAPVSLIPNTEYWLHFTVTGSQTFYALASSNTENAIGTWDFTEVWTLQPQTSPSWGPINGLTPAVRLHATESVPEPVTALLGSLGLLLVLRRRR